MNNTNLSAIAIVLAIISLAISFTFPSLTGQLLKADFPTTTPVFNSTTFGEPEWQCFAQECIRFIAGQEWVNQNCRLNETSNEFDCFVVINNQAVVVPLSAINISSVRSCAETVCTLEILTRNVSQ